MNAHLLSPVLCHPLSPVACSSLKIHLKFSRLFLEAEGALCWGRSEASALLGSFLLCPGESMRAGAVPFTSTYRAKGVVPQQSQAPVGI